MDTILESGGVLLDACGRPVCVVGEEALVHRAKLRLSAKRGGFAYDPELGSRLHTLAPCTPEEQVRAFAQEALCLTSFTVESARCSKKLPLTVTVMVRSGKRRWEIEVKPEIDV